jgi:hypothetical protein
MTPIVKHFNFVTDKTEVIVAVGGEDLTRLIHINKTIKDYDK